MLMPVKFPYQLMISYLVDVEKCDLIPGIARRALTADGIKMPVDFLAVLNVSVSEQIKPVFADLLCPPNNVGVHMR